MGPDTPNTQLYEEQFLLQPLNSQVEEVRKGPDKGEERSRGKKKELGLEQRHVGEQDRAPLPLTQQNKSTQFHASYNRGILQRFS